ncbi:MULTISPECIES: 4-hydroxy-tetrahydrodipicolinate reductase [Methanobacterium]|jgi:4-hydroxy-tetrahydrodipicolinate reductase|uniref:4-hydroxy-tetrahydrodipicolinate reductase n=1 Tax=Methanobacterium subterraneum TaxID=59277 RepID=A0A7K4DQR6_9EURY|nr:MULTISPECIES: 4-hydroxy-tetrahydrodipicolinate reductase [Methanobacterium]AUB58438.1 4-hydroxy-tetrahydrodipicolinate reductase [Methanobacterium sp. MZ-A1]MCC7560106.1 4-hydroxy-tetrahydrodipicolinate reductase [Methanobacterium sp.]NMO10356.1 4-hydroxy-tetrahydrodipicolinate reductase [Methanobacterium subterraneum]
MINVAVTGAGGRMGSMIINTILEQDDLNVVAAIEAPNTPLDGRDVGEVMGIGPINVPIVGAEKLAETLKEKKPDVLVDFTIREAAVSTIKTTAECGVNLVVGTTGFTEEQMKSNQSVIEHNQVRAVISPNMAVGVNVFFKVVEELAGILTDYDVEIIEAHHKHKKDAPSGTAVKAAELIAGALNRKMDEVGVYGREGMVGERTPEEIGIHAVRGGDIVGDHTVLFAGDGERLEITHRASSRQAFVNGVIKSIRYVVSAGKGKVSNMDDVLGL